jgi:hypothetical protein
MSDNMVKFLMPDGTEVSNDPKFGLAEALQKQLDATPNTGDAGIHNEDQKAQTLVEHAASLNSTQPGVGENATVDDPTLDAHGPLGSPAQQRQVEDAKAAKEAGASPQSTSVDDPEPVDSNEQVLEARKARQKRQEAAAKAEDDLGDDGPGDPDQPYSEWSGKQLKAEALRRNADRDEEGQIPLKGVRKSSELAELLEQDDSATADQE